MSLNPDYFEKSYHTCPGEEAWCANCGIGRSTHDGYCQEGSVEDLNEEIKNAPGSFFVKDVVAHREKKLRQQALTEGKMGYLSCGYEMKIAPGIGSKVWLEARFNDMMYNHAPAWVGSDWALVSSSMDEMVFVRKSAETLYKEGKYQEDKAKKLPYGKNYDAILAAYTSACKSVEELLAEFSAGMAKMKNLVPENNDIVYLGADLGFEEPGIVHVTVKDDVRAGQAVYVKNDVENIMAVYDKMQWEHYNLQPEGGYKKREAPQAKIGCNCDIKDLMSSGHSPACPEKK